tara:strand:- start:842 stop:2692 length:1851 start_codon:yes stop_codon:yes gene_type:complete
MKVTIAVDTDTISKQDYVNELQSEGLGDVSRSLNVDNNTTPEMIEVEVDTEEEFVQILTSDKVAGAQSDRLEIQTKIDGTRSISPVYSSTNDISHQNWGLAAMTQSSSTLATSYTFEKTGTDIDCVIMDTGIVTGHPEFRNTANNATRIQQINWGGSQGGSFYTDPNGHGTHVAGIMCGRTCGWASDANIYSFTTNLSGLSHGYGASSMGYITTWHNSKGNGNPTVVNMSWATSTYYPPNHPSYFHSPGSWDPSTDKTYHMTRSNTYDSIVRNMVNAGIVVVCSAGNDNDRVYATSESGWDNGYWYYFDGTNSQNYGTNEKIWATNDTSTYAPDTSPRTDIVGSEGKTCYYQGTGRGQSPGNAWLQDSTSTRHDIAVQAHNQNKSKASYSNYGTPLPIYAPGSYIASSYINSGGAVELGSTGYYYRKLSGTSMASPNIAGMVACYLDKDASTYGAVTTKANQESALAFLSANQRTNDITDFGGGVTNLDRAYTPYQDYTITWNLGDGASSYTIGTLNNGDTFGYDLSATFRNAASEQLHTVSYSITSGGLPTGTSMSSSGITSGDISGYYGSSNNVSFTLRVSNGYDNESKDYDLTINSTEGTRYEGISFKGVTLE